MAPVGISTPSPYLCTAECYSGPVPADRVLLPPSAEICHVQQQRWVAGRHPLSPLYHYSHLIINERFARIMNVANACYLLTSHRLGSMRT